MKASPNKWLVGAVLGAAVVVGSAANAFWNARQLHDDAYWVSHTQDVLHALDDLLSTAKDAETGQRGFIITGDSSYLQPYAAAVAMVDDKIGRIAELTVDNPLQQSRLPHLRQLVGTKLAELDSTLDAYARLGAEAARRQVLTNLGKATMDSLRAAIAEAKDEETRLLVERQAASDDEYAHTIWSGVILALLSVGTILVFLRVVGRDEAERETANALIYAERERFRTTLAGIGDAVIATDTDGRITFINIVAQILTGWKEAEALGQPLTGVFRIINEHTRATVDDPSRLALSAGRIVSLANHTVLISRTGKEIPIEDSAAPLRDRDERTIGAVLVFRDVTEARSAREALRDADRRKDEFLATLAHELRNPLAAIRNALEVLALGQTGNEPVTSHHARGIMDRQTRLLARLVDDLLDISRIASGKIELRTERVALGPLVETAVEAIRPSIVAAGHDLSVTVAADTGQVNADPARLVQVFSNLIGNAAKYTEPGGRIWVNAERRDHRLVVSVRDTGIGIAAEDLARVFEPFQQLESGARRSHGGLGLGLSLARAIVALHGGGVEARSDGPGKGSEFIVRLPAVSPSKPSPPRGHTPSGSHTAVPAR